MGEASTGSQGASCIISGDKSSMYASPHLTWKMFAKS